MSGYNGWTNYETWAVALWLGNDEYLANEWRPEMTAAAWEDAETDSLVIKGVFSREDTAERILAGRIREYVEDPDNGLVPDLDASLGSDLLRAALSEVDWLDIATNWMSDFTPEPSETED